MSERTRRPILPVVAWSLWAATVAGILLRVWLKPHANTLYTTFRNGGARWLATQNLYPKVDEYIYSPLVAACFAPLALLPDGLAGILWRLLALAAFAGGFAVWIGREPAGRAAAGWLLVLPLSVGDLFNGQANPFVIGLLMLAIPCCREGRWWIAALCVALPAYFKVYPLAMGLLLCVLHPRALWWRLGLMIAALFALSLVLQRPAYVLEQYANWFHSLGQDPRRTLNYFGTYRDFWLLLRLLRVPISMRGWAILQAVSGMALAAWLWAVKRRGAAAGLQDFLLLALGVCWMLLFGPATESATYVILAPPLALTLLRRDREQYYAAAISCYALLLASQMLSSWAHKHQNACTHLIQPTGAMILAGALLLYGWRETARSRAGACSGGSAG